MKRLTSNQIHAAIYSEMCYLSNLIPNNPADMKAILENAHATAKELPALALVVSSLVRTADYGGLVDATEEWRYYCKKYPREGRLFNQVEEAL